MRTPSRMAWWVRGALAGVLAAAGVGPVPAGAAAAAPESGATHPPIPVRFSLKEPGYVTLVVDDANGVRVRNLISETRFGAGDHTAWWDGLDDPGQMTFDRRESIYVSDRGASHQVKVFTPEGKVLRVIALPGKSALGAYDPRCMNNPAGITIDSRDRLWVAEQDYTPKRVSIWTLDGKLVRALYGPPQYGGAGRSILATRRGSTTAATPGV